MTAHAPEAHDLTLRRPIQEAAAAAADADRALTRQDHDALREAVLVLARSTNEVLSQLDRRDVTRSRPQHLKDVLGWWQQQLDEARLQVALAEMDAHDVRDELVVALERRFSAVSELISSSVERMTMTLINLRKEIQAYRPGGPSEGKTS